MRICLIGPVPPFRGGIAKYCHFLAQELEKRHDLLLLSYRRQYPALLFGRKSQVDPSGSEAETATEFRRLSYELDSVNPLSWRRARRTVTAFRPDLVILPWWVAYWAPMYGYLLSSLRKRGIRVLFLCINVYEHEDSFFRRTLTRAILKRADSMIVHASQEKEAALEIAPRARVLEHPLPVFAYGLPAVCATPGRGLRMLFFGFVREYKGLDILLEALAVLHEEEVTLTIAGEFWEERSRYDSMVSYLGIEKKVTIIDGYLPEKEMNLLFSEADLVVLPYRRAVTSGVIATAYGFGRPVLATDVGEFGETVRDGYTGKLVPAGDPRALADGIRWFLQRRGVDFAANIADFTSREMSWGSLVTRIEGMYRREEGESAPQMLTGK